MVRVLRVGRDGCILCVIGKVIWVVSVSGGATHVAKTLMCAKSGSQSLKNTDLVWEDKGEVPWIDGISGDSRRCDSE